MVDFKTLETFMWVANLRSFRGAAEKLNTTQPAVSMRIAQLEDDLGVRLLERDRRLVSPTEKGRLLLGYADRLIRLRAETVEAVGDRTTMRGIVRLGVSETIVHTWLPTLIERVNAAYPGLELEIEVDISPNLRDRLVAKDLNLGLLLGPISNPGVHSRPLCSFPLAFVAGARIKFGEKSVSLVELAKWPIITFSRNTQPYIFVRELFARSDLPPAILAHVVRENRLRQLKTEVSLPDLNFVVSWPSAPDSFAAQKVAEIAIRVARHARTGKNS